mgnify:CR=1 FL=1
MDFRKLYENRPGPLVEAKELIVQNLYITEDGTRIRYLGEDSGSMAFEIDTSSPLNEGYLVSELSNDKGGLPLFWKLLNKKHEDSSSY